MKEKEKQKEKNTFLHIISGISLLVMITYFIVTIIHSSNVVNQLETILQAGLLTVMIIFFLFTVMSTQQKRKIYAIITLLCFLCYSGLGLLTEFNILTLPTQPIVPNFTNRIFTEAVTWANEHDITLEQTYEYSDTVSENDIIYQTVAPNTLVKKVKKFTIVISNGADQEKEVTIPNMIGWSADDVLKFIKRNFLSNVEVEFIISDKAKDTVIEQEGTGSRKRNDKIKLTFSIGHEEDIKEFKIKDLKGLTKFEATFYLKQHGVKTYETPEDYSSYKRGLVMKQNIEAGKKVDPKKDKVIVTISKGQKITIPDFSKMTMKEVTEWITKNRLKVTFKDQYDDSVKEGYVIKSNYKKGEVVEEGTSLEFVISKGKLAMPTTLSVSDFKAWADKYGIAYIENYEFNEEVKQGDAIKWSHKAGQTIKNNETVTITISQGKAIKIPSFIGMTKSQIQSKCNSLGIGCTFQYSYSNSVAKGKAISQSKEVGSEVAEGSYIDINLSNGPRPSGGSSSGGSSGSSGGGSTPPAPTCTANGTYTLVIQPSWVTGGSANTTINTLRSKLSSKYPNITFHFSTRDGNQPAGFIHEDSPITNGSTIQDCKTYTIIINN